MAALLALQHVLLSFILQVAFFPLWWYTGGARKIMSYAITEIESIFDSFHIGTLARFLTTPLFGFRDPFSRVMSVGIRCVHFCVMCISSSVISAFWILVLFVWLIVPLLTIYQIWFHFFA